MSRVGILILLGIVNMLVPFSGLPVALRSLCAVVIGACVFSIGLSLCAQDMQKNIKRVEHAGADQTPAHEDHSHQVVSEPSRPSSVS